MSKTNNNNSSGNQNKQDKSLKQVHVNLEQALSKEETGQYLVDIGQN